MGPSTSFLAYLLPLKLLPNSSGSCLGLGKFIPYQLGHSALLVSPCDICFHCGPVFWCSPSLLLSNFAQLVTILGNTSLRDFIFLFPTYSLLESLGNFFSQFEFLSEKFRNREKYKIQYSNHTFRFWVQFTTKET